MRDDIRMGGGGGAWVKVQRQFARPGWSKTKNKTADSADKLDVIHTLNIQFYSHNAVLGVAWF